MFDLLIYILFDSSSVLCFVLKARTENIHVSCGLSDDLGKARNHL